MSEQSAIHCEHANEVPMSCPCPPDCYCKSHTCKPTKVEEPGKLKTLECHRLWDLELTADRIVDHLAEVTLEPCPRCHEEHKKLMFKKLMHSSEYTHWSMCPLTMEPILISSEPLEDEEKES